MSDEKLWQRHGRKIHFRNPDMDFYLMWALGHTAYSGAEIGECFYAASRIKEGDPASWGREWVSMAARVEEGASKSEAGGHTVSAREAYLRASTYYRTTLAGMSVADSGFRQAASGSARCFRKAAELFDPPLVPVSVPFEGSALPGYLAGVPGSCRPTVIMIGGGETSAEELYFWAGAPALRRGYTALMVDLPGQGSTPFDGLYLRPDAEAPIKAIIDFAQELPEVDSDALALFGISGGGYMACRAAALDTRAKALVANAPIMDIYRLATAEVPAAILTAPGLLQKLLFGIAGRRNRFLSIALERFCWQSGVDSWSDALELAQSANLYELVGRITCPVLCLIGAAESSEAMFQAQRFFGELTVEDKDFRVLTAEEGADAHCQVNNFSLQHATVFDWLDQTMKAKSGQF